MYNAANKYCGFQVQLLHLFWCNWIWYLVFLAKLFKYFYRGVMFFTWWGGQQQYPSKRISSRNSFRHIGIILSSIMDGKNQSTWQVVHARVVYEGLVKVVTVANNVYTVNLLILATPKVLFNIIFKSTVNIFSDTLNNITWS